MSRAKKLIILLVVLVVLCAAAVLVSRLNLEQSVEEAEAETIFSLEDTTVTGLSWTYEDETLHFTYSEEDGWTYADDAAFPLNDSPLQNMVSGLTEVTSTRTVEAPEDLSEYGLEEPACTVTVTTEAGTTELSFGDTSALGDAVYLTLGDGSVYLADTALPTYFEYGLYDLVAMETLPAMNSLTSFTVEAETGNLELDYLENSGLAYTDALVWFAPEEDGYTALDTDLTEDFIGQITGLSWASCADYYADDDELAAYGLDNPTALVAVGYTETVQQDTGEVDEDGETVYEDVTEDHTFLLEIGGYESDDYCYARISGSRMVYLIDASISDSLLYTTPADLLPTDILQMDWDTVDTMDITLDGGETVYTVTRSAEDVEDEDGNVTTQVTYTCDGDVVDLADVLDDLNAMASTGSDADATAERSELLRIVFHRNTDTFPEVSLAFYAYDSSSCLVEQDGTIRLYAGRSDVEDVTDALEELLLN